MSTPLVSLITVNYNGLSHLETFFSSVYAQEGLTDALEVLMVDNGSSDGSVAFVREKFPNVRIIEAGENLGFAKANNLAADAAKGKYLGLLNNDMKLEPDWVKTMVDYREQGPADMPCIGSRILNWDGSLVDFIEGTLAFNGMGFQTSFQAPVDSEAGRAFPDQLLFACGGALLIDRAVFLEVGGFDEDYFAYFEDVDLGWRLWVLGYRVGFCPEAVVFHRHNGTSAQFGMSKKLVLFERNALYTVIKNYDQRSLDVVLPAAMLLAFKRMAVRAGVSREDYRFALTSAPPPLAPAPAESLSTKAWRLFRQQGLKAAVKRSLVMIAEKILARYKPLPPAPVNPDLQGINREAYSTVVGLEDLGDHLPRLMEKRAKIQSARRRSDGEIFKLFKTPFQPVEGRADYLAVHAAALDQLGVKAYFEARMNEVNETNDLEDTRTGTPVGS
jgi:GT2 family glycosyltransferase